MVVQPQGTMPLHRLDRRSVAHGDAMRGRTREASGQMKRTVVLLVAITLGGCLPDRAKDVAACRLEADRFYQVYQDVDVGNPRSQYIIACMAAKGYDFDVSPADCDSRHALPAQSACYTPNGWLAWLIDQFRRALKSN